MKYQMTAEKVAEKRKGAPPKPENQKQDATRVVYMTAETLKKIQEKAKRAGQSFSGYVQRAALEAAE